VTALERPSFAPDALATGQISGEHRGRFGQTVTIAHRPPQALKPPDQTLIELGTPRNQKAQPGSDPGKQWPEQEAADAPAKTAAQPDRQAQKPVEEGRRKPAACRHPGVETGNQRRVEPGHADDAGGRAQAKRLDNLRTGEALREDHRDTTRQRRQ